MIVLILCYWLLSGFLGNKLIQMKIAGIPTFFMFLGIGIVYFALTIIKCKGMPRSIYGFRSADMKLWKNNIILFSLLSLAYMLLSYLEFFTSVFDLDVLFDKSYIFRHGYIVFSFPISFTIITLICRNKNKVLLFLKSRHGLLMVWLLMVIGKAAVGSDFRTYRAIIVFFGSAIFFNNPRKISSWIVALVTCFYGSGIEASSTTLVCLICAISCIIFIKEFTKITKRNLGVKVYFIVVLLALLVYALEAGILLIHDANSMWRIQYWVYEFKTLMKTYFAGVGYGTAYASSNLLLAINNASVFTSQAGEGTGVFVIAQHNSLMNCLYRLGFVGFLLSIRLFITQPLRWTSHVLIKARFEDVKMIKWALFNFIFNLIIILLNPGLESPPFYMGYLISYSVLIALIIIKEKEI